MARPRPVVVPGVARWYLHRAELADAPVRDHRRVEQVLPVSSGGGYPYTGLDGVRYIATIAEGQLRDLPQGAGLGHELLGHLYYPVYFQGGYAIHGSKSVPPRPVSHGCVRMPIWLAEEFYRDHPVGTTVIVR